VRVFPLPFFLLMWKVCFEFSRNESEERKTKTGKKFSAKYFVGKSDDHTKRNVSWWRAFFLYCVRVSSIEV
jgi:hypothetical protein